MRPNPTSPLLPLFDDSDSPPQSPGARRSPTAFICYAHETRTHNHHVEDLAHKLRAQGVDCNADIFEVSPPEGWFRWMLTQVKDSDFVGIRPGAVEFLLDEVRDAVRTAMAGKRPAERVYFYANGYREGYRRFEWMRSGADSAVFMLRRQDSGRQGL